MSDFLFFSGSSNLPLAEKVARGLGMKLGKEEIDHFSNGETRVRIDEDVKNKTCFFLQSLSTPTDKNWVETLFFLDALKRSGAKKVIGVLPWLGYQKQDKVFRRGEGISVAVVIKTLEEMGMEKIITFDLHSPGILNYFQNKPTVLSAFPIFLDVIRNTLLSSRAESRDLGRSRASLDSSARPSGLVGMTDFLIVAPDEGAYWAKEMAQKLNLALVQLKKTRDKKTARITITPLSGEMDRLDGKTIIIIDDVIYTGATLILAAKLLKQHGVKKVICFATHAIFSGNAASNLQNSEIDSLTVADTVFVPKEKLFPKLKIVSVCDIISSCNFPDLLLN